MLTVFLGCERESAYATLLTEDYPELYTHIFERNADSLLTFTDHPNSFVREQAWRGLISTPVDNIDDLITQVQYQNTPVAWSALSNQELSEDQLSRLRDLWNTRASLRNGISLVLGKQGDQASLDFLVRNFENFIDTDFEYETALAISRLMTEHEVNDSSQKVLFRYAAVIDEPELFRAYFYGHYRNNRALESTEMQQTLWETYEWTDQPAIKQYAAGILFNTDAEWFLERLAIDEVSNMNVQLAIELAQHSGKLSWSEKLEGLYSQLLEHSNPVVNEVALSQIKDHPEQTSDFDQVIISSVVDNEEKEASIRLSGIIALTERSNYLELADSLSEGNEYLLVKKLDIYKEEYDPETYLNELEPYFSSENRMETLFAAQSLSGWWGELTEDQRAMIDSERVKELAFRLLEKGDRSITYVTTGLLRESNLVDDNDYSKLEALINTYKLPEDVEVYQAFGQLLRDHFQEQSKPLIDSLAKIGNTALNSTFRQQGWEIPEVESISKDFRNPNWQRLAELEYGPVWVLETQKGTIKIAMDVLSAPATISGMDSLTIAGAYDGIAFHRVVPNFVIQGGDVETGDGFGGPDYVVPTEASEKEYKRGRVGIASAGRDTEGSQYFVMHQWKPHLNTGYTIIGEVIEGMEVVDQILVGDKVVQAYWQQNLDE
ncbi:MAG TPA: peptidylprolyl isomerase [Gracilimonas sp.]|uniref:peptidylprolyl isomerase n=1 Tax=Gracilimonas sp. TaxID=1974203 RepID=UPI002D9E4037|nr:peptidylprolyl isomerase [Gracilimonas sp.]